MQEIGPLIKALRKKNKLSAQALSQGICSTKYIYMIEHNERYPSADILHKLFHKLRFDYVKYLRYADLPDALKITELVTRIDMARDFGDMVTVKAFTSELYRMDLKALKMYTDFNLLVVDHVVGVNDGECLQRCYQALNIEDYRAFDRGRLNQYDLNELYLYDYLAYLVYLSGDHEEGLRISKAIFQFFSLMDPMEAFDQFVTVNIIHLACLYQSEGDYGTSLEVLLHCQARQFKRMIAYCRHQVYYLTGLAYKNLKKYDKAKELAEVAGFYCETIGNEGCHLKVKALLEEIKIEDRRHSNRVEGIRVLAREEVQLPYSESKATVQVFVPNIVYVTIKGYANGIIEATLARLGTMLDLYLPNEDTYHLIYDTRYVFQGEFNLDFSLKSQSKLLEQSLNGRSRASVLRLEDALNTSNPVAEAIYKSFEASGNNDGVRFVGRVKSLADAMNIIAALEQIRA